MIFYVQLCYYFFEFAVNEMRRESHDIEVGPFYFVNGDQTNPVLNSIPSSLIKRLALVDVLLNVMIGQSSEIHLGLIHYNGLRILSLYAHSSKYFMCLSAEFFQQSFCIREICRLSQIRVFAPNDSIACNQNVVWF